MQFIAIIYKKLTIACHNGITEYEVYFIVTNYPGERERERERERVMQLFMYVKYFSLKRRQLDSVDVF